MARTRRACSRAAWRKPRSGSSSRRPSQRVSRASGKPCVGWIGQDYAESERTPFLLAEIGLAYVADWPNDDLPYLMADGQIVSLPNQSELDDVQLMWHRRVLAPRYAEIVAEAASELSAEA